MSGVLRHGGCTASVCVGMSYSECLVGWMPGTGLIASGVCLFGGNGVDASFEVCLEVNSLFYKEPVCIGNLALRSRNFL